MGAPEANGTSVPAVPAAAVLDVEHGVSAPQGTLSGVPLEPRGGRGSLRFADDTAPEAGGHGLKRVNTNAALLRDIDKGSRIVVEFAGVSAWVPVLFSGASSSAPPAAGAGGKLASWVPAGPLRKLLPSATQADLKQQQGPKERQVLYNLSGVIEPGEVLALMGEEGVVCLFGGGGGGWVWGGGGACGVCVCVCGWVRGWVRHGRGAEHVLIMCKYVSKSSVGTSPWNAQRMMPFVRVRGWLGGWVGRPGSKPAASGPTVRRRGTAVAASGLRGLLPGW